jgi:uncharacterized phage protein (predicted DNA packaging)
MTNEEKTAYMYVLKNQAKKYCRIDYDDDEDIIQLIIDSVIEQLSKLIGGFDPYNMTNSQRLLTLMLVKETYDNRDPYQSIDKKLSDAASTLLLGEMYKG